MQHFYLIFELFGFFAVLSVLDGKSRISENASLENRLLAKGVDTWLQTEIELGKKCPRQLFLPKKRVALSIIRPSGKEIDVNEQKLKSTRVKNYCKLYQELDFPLPAR